MSLLNKLPLPTFFDPKNAEDYNYSPDEGLLFTEAPAWAKKLGVKPAASAKQKVHLLVIDGQRSFTHPKGSLFVAGRSGRGAIDDSVRTAEFIYKNLGVITDITTTLDTHFAFQIFFSSFWVDQEGRPLSPHTLIVLSKDETHLNNTDVTGKVLHERVQPNPIVASWLCNGNYGWLVKQCFHYCRELAKAGKYTLYLWPPHCLLGSSGHALSGVIHEARLFHAIARGTQTNSEIKGGNPLSENYSVFRAEVLDRFDGQPLAQRNTAFVKTLMTADRVIGVGQAKSHCVKSTVEDYISEIVAVDPKLASKMYIVEDLMSAVTVPDGKGGFAADFTPQADEAIDRFRQAGMHVVRSTDPIESWPDMELAA